MVVAGRWGASSERGDRLRLVEHRYPDAALSGNLDRPLVARVGVMNHAHARIGGQHALELPGGELGAVGHHDHPGMLRVADADPATVMDRDPAGAGGRVDERVE